MNYEDWASHTTAVSVECCNSSEEDKNRDEVAVDVGS